MHVRRSSFDIRRGQFLIGAIDRRQRAAPFFSICVPQYNRTDFLIAACATFAGQHYTDFELCISDDCSNDGRTEDLLRALDGMSLSYVFVRTGKNLRYDGNLRNAISLSRGRFLLLMGNDDGLTDRDVLQTLRGEIIRHEPVAVAVTNYREADSGNVQRRVRETRIIGAGPAVAAATFRRYSFVSGVVLEGNGARSEASSAYDGSEMYQMYLGTRLIAAGGRFLAIDRVCVDKDLKIAGQVVDSYRLKPRIPSFPVIERPLPMRELFRVVAGGLEPYHDGAARARNLTAVAKQLYQFIYPFWTIEFRRIHSWGYALGVLLAVRPSKVTQGIRLPISVHTRAWFGYITLSILALTTPIAFFDACKPWFYSWAKRIRPPREVRTA